MSQSVQELRSRLADRAFLFDDPHAYLAGVEAALRAVEAQRPDDRRPDAPDRPASPQMR